MTPAFFIVKIKNIIYKIITDELKKIKVNKLDKKSTLVNFTSSIKKKIEKTMGEYYGSGYKSSTDKDGEGDSKGIKENKGNR
tara:strand:- start:77 stop:322 length:246 start_codon:yes stop_codon:yes gene_type:complete